MMDYNTGNAGEGEAGGEVKERKNLGAFFFGAAEKKPGFPLQLLALPRCGVSAAIPCAAQGLITRFARCPPLRPVVTANHAKLFKRNRYYGA
jgi:hypothetical protein